MNDKRPDFNLEYLPALVTALKLYELMREPEDEAELIESTGEWPEMGAN